MYFGFLIPKSQRVVRLDLVNMKNIIAFKHGLMLLHQLIDMIIKIHQDPLLTFGHIDFQNLYYVYNKHKPNQMRSPKKGQSNQNYEKQRSCPSNFSVSLLFIEKNLYNLTIDDSLQSNNESKKMVSQTSVEDQESFCLNHLDKI